jgi:general secretion pathway protein M
VSLSERLERLDARERRLLGVFAVVVATLLVLAVPVLAATIVGSRRSENDELREAMEQIQAERATIARASASKLAVQQRYSTPAPPLAGQLERWAQEIGLEIPESQDRPMVPHGKYYEQRATKIVLRKTGMLKLAKFLEKLKQSPYPISIDQMNLRKRGTEPDSYDVDMVVSAYDRKEPPKAEKAAATEQAPEQE